MPNPAKISQASQHPIKSQRRGDRILKTDFPVICISRRRFQISAPWRNTCRPRSTFWWYLRFWRRLWRRHPTVERIWRRYFWNRLYFAFGYRLREASPCPYLPPTPTKGTNILKCAYVLMLKDSGTKASFLRPLVDTRSIATSAANTAPQA